MAVLPGFNSDPTVEIAPIYNAALPCCPPNALVAPGVNNYKAATPLAQIDQSPPCPVIPGFST